MAHATDTTAEDFARNVALEIRIVAPKQGDACFALIAPDPEGAVKVTQVDLGTLDDFDLDRIAEAIEKTATEPNPVPTHDQVARVVDPVLLSAKRRQGDGRDLARRLGEPGIDKNKGLQDDGRRVLAGALPPGLEARGRVDPLSSSRPSVSIPSRAQRRPRPERSPDLGPARIRSAGYDSGSSRSSSRSIASSSARVPCTFGP
jgi:hypothetical protein